MTKNLSISLTACLCLSPLVAFAWGEDSSYGQGQASSWDTLQRAREQRSYENSQREQQDYRDRLEAERRNQWSLDQRRDPQGYNRNGGLNPEPPPLGYCCEYVPNHGARR
jgi:hypothetical protein